MGQYLKLFDTHTNYQNFVNSGEMLRPNVSHCVVDQHVHYNPFIDYSKEYLTFESLEDDNTIYLKASDASITKTISVSTDNGSTWTECTSSSTNVNGTTLATLNIGDKLLIKGENSTYATFSKINCFKSTGQFEVKGNIMSLVNGDSFVNSDRLTGAYTFRSLFFGCTELTSAKNLILPATTLASDCYSIMFSGCTSLATAPELPATTLKQNCYNGMFSGCTSLTAAPELPATTLASNCYRGMFDDCSNLTKEAIVPSSVTPVNSSYCYAMYCGCTKITIPNGNYNGQAYNCESLS